METRIEIATKIIASLIICGGGLPSDEQIKQMTKAGLKVADAILDCFSADSAH